MALLPLIRKVEPNDIDAVDIIIKQVMTEFQCIGPGYSIEDPEVKNIYAAYQGRKKAFYVIELAGEILGCGGFAPLNGDAKNTCELRKMYFLTRLRGLGMGSKLLDLCISEAKKKGFNSMYLETVFRMEAANKLYRRKGFIELPGAKGNTGHSSCDSFYELIL